MHPLTPLRALPAQASHPVFAGAVHEAPRQEVGDRFDIALLNLPESRLNGRHDVYQWA